MKTSLRGGINGIGPLNGQTRSVVHYVAGSDAPIVLPLEGSYKGTVLERFLADAMTEEAAREKRDPREIWYGLVNGMHRLTAIRELACEDPGRWGGFSWPVLMLKGGQNIEVLRRLARQQNRKQSSLFFVETTFYDLLRGLKEEDRYLQEKHGKKPTANEVATAYDGVAHQ